MKFDFTRLNLAWSLMVRPRLTVFFTIFCSSLRAAVNCCPAHQTKREERSGPSLTHLNVESNQGCDPQSSVCPIPLTSVSDSSSNVLGFLMLVSKRMSVRRNVLVHYKHLYYKLHIWEKTILTSQKPTQMRYRPLLWC